MRRGCLVGWLVLSLSGCVPTGGVVPVEPEAAQTAEGFVLSGQITMPPNPSATTAPSESGLAPTAAPSGEAYTPFAVHVTAESDDLELNVAPPPGRPERYRSTARVSALVTMSNGHSHRDVTWESSAPHMATVDAQGTVRGVGMASGMVAITAYSRDRQASGSVWLRMTNVGDAEVVVD